MRVEKALIVIFALVIATFLIGVGKYNAHYAGVHHTVVSKRAA